MKSLSSYLLYPKSTYIYKKFNNIDGHIHLFNHESIIDDSKLKYDNEYKRAGFIDIEFDNIDKFNFVENYSNYIKNHYDSNKDILLATATTIEDIKTIYIKFPNIIKGFGELKCYDEYRGKPVNYKQIKLVRQVCELSQKVGNLPVYVHWEINDKKDLNKIENVIKKYPSVPIILCHCCMNDNNQEYAYNCCIKLMNMYSNVWIDISYTALNFFVNNPMRLYNLRLDRVFIGSDVNIKLFGPNHDFEKEYNEICNKLIILDKYINSGSNLKKLFNI